MMATMDDVRRQCHVSEEEESLLTSQQCPIVLLRWRDDSSIVPEVAPRNLYLGVMLPYTPLHHILLRDVRRPLVMTSGNLSEEPIAQSNDEARQRLGPLADAFLMHNRDIYARYDDSVVFVTQSPTCQSSTSQSTQYIRRSRGYAPLPVRLPFKTGQMLATGSELKNTFSLTRDDFAFVSQHIGDMENLETLEHFEASVALFQHIFRTEPELFAHDLHPDYFATKFAQAQSSDGRDSRAHPAPPGPHRFLSCRQWLGNGIWPRDRCGLGWYGLWIRWPHLGWGVFCWRLPRFSSVRRIWSTCLCLVAKALSEIRGDWRRAISML